MNLSRKWLNEFVPNISVNDIDDKDFCRGHDHFRLQGGDL